MERRIGEWKKEMYPENGRCLSEKRTGRIRKARPTK